MLSWGKRISPEQTYFRPVGTGQFSLTVRTELAEYKGHTKT